MFIRRICLNFKLKSTRKDEYENENGISKSKSEKEIHSRNLHVVTQNQIKYAFVA